MKQILIFTCLLLFGCKQVSKESAVSEIAEESSFEKIIIIDPIDENVVLKYSDIYEDIQYVKLETRSDNLIGRIDKIITTDDKFIILDIAIARKVFIFDRSGKFLNIIGKNGEGPGEYDSPNDIAYDEYNDELLVWCHNKKTIMKFRLDGTFVKGIKIDWWASSIYVVGENLYLAYLNNYTQGRGKINDYNILIYDDDGNVVSRLLPYNKEKIVMSPPSGTIFSTFQQELLFAPYYSNMTFRIDLDSAKIQNKYYFDFGEHNIPRSLFDHSVTPKEFDKTVRGDSNYAFNITFIETSSHIVNLFVYKRRIYTCIHSKESGITRFASVFFNDIRYLHSGGMIYTCKDNLLIGCVEPKGFVELQSTVKEIKKSSDNIKEVMLKKMKTPSFLFGNELNDNFPKVINSSTITLSEKEI
ncbi:MAG: 6-bladed beta-propeller, partial [Dysgonamonadaceae bacterium]|nr:6-bladed beta-propeller [Dysgonamonadaceae bacterium]